MSSNNVVSSFTQEIPFKGLLHLAYEVFPYVEAVKKLLKMAACAVNCCSPVTTIIGRLSFMSLLMCVL